MNYNLGRAVGQVDIDTRGLKDADISLREAGRGMLYTGTALVGAFGYVIKTAADFEKEMDFVAAINQESAASMDLLREKALDLGRRGPFGPREVAASFVELAKAGIDAQTIVDGVGDATVNLAAAADIGLVESSEILVNTLKTFNLEAEDAVRTVDIIAGAANASTIDVEDFAYSMRYAGSIASALGIDVMDTATAIAILGDRGIKGSTGGTSLRRILLNLQPASEKAGDALKELGIITEDGTNQFFTAEGNAKSLAEVFEILGDSLDGLTAAERIEKVNAIFGARAAPSALILAEQGAEGMEKYADAINRVSAEDVAEQRLDNLAGAFLKLKSAIEATFITAGTPFQKMLQGWVEALTAVVVWFGELDPRIQSFILGAVGVVGVLSLMAGAFLLTIGNIVRAIRVMGQIATFFQLMGGAKGAAGAASKVGLLSRAFGFLLSPLGLIILAVVAAVAAFIYFYNTSETFRNFINGLGEDIKRIWGSVVDWFTGPFVNGIETAWNAVTGFFSSIGDWLSGVPSMLSGAASSVGNWFGDLFGGIGDIGSGAFDGVMGFFESLGNIDIGGPFSAALETVTNFVTEIPGALAGAGEAAVEAFVGFFLALPERAGYILGFVIGRTILWSFQFVTLVGTTAADAVMALINGLIAFIPWLGTFVADIVMAFITFGIELITTVGTFAADMVMALINGLITFIPWLGTFVADIVMAVITWGVQMVMTVGTIAADFVMALINGIINLPTQVADVIWGVISQFPGWAVEFGNGAWSIGTAFFNGVIDAITGIPGAILGIINNGIGMFTDMVGGAYDAARSFGGGLWQGFKDGMGISSPSYIERALFAVEGQAFQTAANLNGAIKEINAHARRLPDTVFSTAGENAEKGGLTAINGGATVGVGATRGDAGGRDVTVNIKIGTLGNGVTAQDALKLSRLLATETQKQLEAAGEPVVKRGRAISTTPA